MGLVKTTMGGWTALAVAVIVGCAPTENGAAQGEPRAESGETAAGERTAQEVQRPDTTVEAVWAHLQAQAYRESWPTWPGKGELYAGGEPHGMLLTTYVNGAALDALRTGAGAMPVGAIIVKENYMASDSSLAAVTVMYKTESFNPDHNSWWFLKRNADGSVDAGGRGAGCESCHGARADNDYILTDDLSRPITGG